jgi:hypothetical protein
MANEAKDAPAWHKREDLFVVPPCGWLLVVTTLLAVALAGGRPLWAQGIVTVGVALLWVLYPPKYKPSKAAVRVLVLVALAPLAAYLPAAWLAMPEWRVGLAEVPSIAASAVVSPQPWMTFHRWLLWVVGVLLAGWCTGQSWDHYNRDTLARMYTAGLAGLTVFAIFGYATGLNPALWESTDGFGPFISRNQWGSVMGMGGVMAMAILHHSFRHSHKTGVIFWGVAVALLAGGILSNHSRGGLVVFIVGGFAYWMFYGLARKQYRYAAIAFSFMLIAFAAFALGGGVLLERFVGTFEEGLSGDLRVEFYRMTMTMVHDAPVAGFGLGNFSFVFPFYQDYEPIAGWRPLHPDNSFLLLASEGGWLLVLVLVAAFGVFFKLSYEARRARPTSIRAAALACTVVLILNTFFEVSAHRIGVLFPGLFLASLSLPPANGERIRTYKRRLMRVGGLLLAGIGLIWIVAAFNWPVLPRVQGTSALRELAGQENQAGNKEQAIALLEQSTQLRPLDWDAHWALAAYQLEAGQADQAWNQFRAVDALLPHLHWMLEQEGYFWLPVNAARTVYAWNRTLQRAPRGQRATKYAGFLRQAKDYPPVQALLLRLYAENPEMEFVRIRNAGPAGDVRLPRFLAVTDNLSHAPDHMVESVLQHMLERGRGDEVRALAEGNPRIKRLGWRVLARQAAQQKNLQEALDLHFQYGPRPALPAPISRSDLRSVERAAALAPMDIATGIAYYQGLESARRHDDAFWQLRRIMDFPNAPAYIWYLAARTAHERGRHEEAWDFLQTYQQKSKQ